MIKKNSRWWTLLMAVVISVAMPLSVQAASDILIHVTKEQPTVSLSDSGERIFDIGYAFGVNFDAKATGLDLVLVLDRSNSMLRIDPSTNLPVADAVKKAVDRFVTEFYQTYPDANVAVVSFGSDGYKRDGWAYYDNARETLDEVAHVFDYRDLYTQYNRNFRSYWNNGYRYAWEHWSIYAGATNIKAAFEYAETTVTNKLVAGRENDQDVILLFTDGVATQGGSYSQSNYNYPTAHNTNTIAAYTAGQAAQSRAEVITVGYFEGIQYETTKTIARDTLERSQNAGLFEASQTGQLTGIFDQIVDELNYAGTAATVKETVEDEFTVVPGSIKPAGYSLTRDSAGRTVIEWPLGNVIVSNYTFGYKVKAKDHVYPTGSGAIKVPINLDAQLTYLDLKGNTVTEYLGRNETTLPPRGNQPLVKVSVTGNDGYLVGDSISMSHSMSFINEAPFDYREILVKDLTKTITGGTLGTDIIVSQDALNRGWAISGSAIVYDIQARKTATPGDNLTWNGQADLTLVAGKAGTYQLDYNVGYRLTNSANIAFDFANRQNDPKAIQVREGVLRLAMTDDHGDAIEDAAVLVDGKAYTSTYDTATKQVVVKGIPSGRHNITFQVPSGYAFDRGDAGVVLVADDIAFTETYSYSNYDVTKAIQLIRLDVRNIGVTDRTGAAVTAISKVTETKDAIITFELIRPLEKVGLNLTDDYVPADAAFALDQQGGFGVVTGPTGQVNGFEVRGGQLIYDGSALPAGIYKAYGVLTPPTGLGDNQDYDYRYYVDGIVTRAAGASADFSQAVTSKALLVGLEDKEAPVITPVASKEKSTTNAANYDVNILDKTRLVEVKVYEGTLTLADISGDTKPLAFATVKDSGNERDINVNLPLLLENLNGKLSSTGAMTIYAKDAFGNESVKAVTLENEDINTLLDNDIK